MMSGWIQAVLRECQQQRECQRAAGNAWQPAQTPECQSAAYDSPVAAEQPPQPARAKSPQQREQEQRK